jgi:hypothetical protein
MPDNCLRCLKIMMKEKEVDVADSLVRPEKSVYSLSTRVLVSSMGHINARPMTPCNIT